uniref:leucine-rich repeat domain-containing protein n=1 Tax=Candidatus Synechococcus spongiarum TaxID=431041 RepID=UPI0013779AFE
MGKGQFPDMLKSPLKREFRTMTRSRFGIDFLNNNRLRPGGTWAAMYLSLAALLLLSPSARSETRNICERHDAFESGHVVIRKLAFENRKKKNKYPWGLGGLVVSGHEICNLSNKGITSLTANDFNGLSHINALLLGGNALTSLPQGVFNKLPNLYYLDLHDTSLTSLPSNMFNGLYKLRHLNLSYNSLR